MATLYQFDKTARKCQKSSPCHPIQFTPLGIRKLAHFRVEVMDQRSTMIGQDITLDSLTEPAAQHWFSDLNPP
ncbi:MAG: hypothetical protein WCH43_09765 [Verrucomicrobiota bacterium]